HYQRATFSEDVGELYDIKADPLERRNLYHDAGHQDVVNTGRRLLLEWLIETTRIKTVQPAPQVNDRGPQHEMAGDGHAGNRHSIGRRRDTPGVINYT